MAADKVKTEKVRPCSDQSKRETIHRYPADPLPPQNIQIVPPTQLGRKNKYSVSNRQHRTSAKSSREIKCDGASLDASSSRRKQKRRGDDHHDESSPRRHNPNKRRKRSTSTSAATLAQAQILPERTESERRAKNLALWGFVGAAIMVVIMGLVLGGFAG